MKSLDDDFSKQWLESLTDEEYRAFKDAQERAKKDESRRHHPSAGMTPEAL